MPPKTKSKETTGSQDTEGNPTAVGLNVQVPIMVEWYEKWPLQGEEV